MPGRRTRVPSDRRRVAGANPEGYEAGERYVVNERGERIGVIHDIVAYRELVEIAEELDAIRAYDAAKASGDETVPFDRN